MDKLLHLGALALILVPALSHGWGFGDEDKVLLKDIEVLTLYSGKMTNGMI